MIVKVIPQRPIPGILPKNKWIDQEMECDLNNAEIVRCMQYGTVCDLNGTVIDMKYLQHFPIIENDIKPIVTTTYKSEDAVIINQISTTTEDIPLEVITTTETTSEEPIVIEVNSEVPEVVTINEEEKIEIINSLELVSCTKEDEYIFVETQFNTNNESISGNLYGLFTILAGSRPVVEVKSEDDEWVKITNKFANYSVIENGQKFVFRLTPKNDSVIKFRVSIKEANSVLVKLDGEVNPSSL